jgi:hypothetical protein
MLNGDVNYTWNLTSFPRINTEFLVCTSEPWGNHPGNESPPTDSVTSPAYIDNKLNEWEIVKILIQKYSR